MRTKKGFSARVMVVICLMFVTTATYADSLLDQLGEPGEWGGSSVPFESGAGCWVADDFTPANDCTIEEFKCQFVYIEGGSSSTTGFKLKIYEEDFSDDPVWEVSLDIEDMDIIATGDVWGSWQVYRAEIELDSGDYYEAVADTTYWFAWQIQNEYNSRNLEVNTGDPNGSRAWQYYQGSWQEISANADAAFYLGGTQQGNVSEVSFGYIKATFK